MVTPPASSPLTPADWAWPFWPVVPLQPYGQRRTLRSDVVPGQIWSFEQIQGVLYVVTPIRMMVVKLAAGGLLVYAPVAPTRECLTLMQQLIDQHGPVRHILLPTVSGIEHKVFVGPFARQFPTAQVWVAPHQWSFPVDLPLSWLGLPPGRTQRLPLEASQTPLGEEFDYAILGPIHLGVGPFEEVALYHRASRSLLVTDSVIAIPEHPPESIQLDPFALLYHAKDHAQDKVLDTPATRLKGWQRIVLFSLYFRPSGVNVVPFGRAWQERSPRHLSPNGTTNPYGGLYPFEWKADWHRSFQALLAGPLRVAPILQRLILNREAQITQAWVERVCQWGFEQVLPCHFHAPVAARGHEFAQAFEFLRSPLPVGSLESSLESSPDVSPDFALLDQLDRNLVRFHITPPRQVHR
jgi:Domain of unknown function (DUF4336)